MRTENQKPDTFSQLTKIEEKYKGIINLILKPLLTILIFSCVGYYTTWLSLNYVKKDKFNNYVSQQIESDQKQDEDSKSQFKITQTKLETIINQQIMFGEQFKGLNLQFSTTQKYLDGVNERITYLERNYSIKTSN